MPTRSTRYLALAICKEFSVSQMHPVCHPHSLHKQQAIGINWFAGPCCQGAHQTNAVFAVHQPNFYIHSVLQKLVLKEQIVAEWSQVLNPPPLGHQSWALPWLLSIFCFLLPSRVFAEQPHGEMCGHYHCCNWGVTQLPCKRGSSCCSGL